MKSVKCVCDCCLCDGLFDTFEKAKEIGWKEACVYLSETLYKNYHLPDITLLFCPVCTSHQQVKETCKKSIKGFFKGKK